jgi:hypothetical protein
MTALRQLRKTVNFPFNTGAVHTRTRRTSLATAARPARNGLPFSIGYKLPGPHCVKEITHALDETAYIAESARPAQCGARQKEAKMFRKTTTTAVSLMFALVASAAQAEVVELTDVQMDQITAGAFGVYPGTSNLYDIRGFTYTFQSGNFIDNQGVVWAPRAIYYFSDNSALGVLINTAGQVWDGGYNAINGPAPTATTVLIKYLYTS